MTSLPTSFLLGPEMADFGFSVAGVALADGEVEIKSAISKLLQALIGVRTAFDLARPEFRKFEGILEYTFIGMLPRLLEASSVLEGAFANGCEKIRRLMGPKFQSAVRSFGEGHVLAELDAFASETRRDYIPTIRRMRMLIIKLIYLRAEERGISDARLDATFEETFMTGSSEEADSWQETAYLMWQPANLSRLITSHEAQAEDHLEEYTRFIEASRSF